MNEVVLVFAQTDTEVLEFIQKCEEIDENELTIVRSCEGGDIVCQILVGINVLLSNPALVELFSVFPQREVLFSETGDLKYAKGYSAKDVIKMRKSGKDVH